MQYATALRYRHVARKISDSTMPRLIACRIVELLSHRWADSVKAEKKEGEKRKGNVAYTMMLVQFSGHVWKVKYAK